MYPLQLTAFDDIGAVDKILRTIFEGINPIAKNSYGNKPD